MNLEQLIALGVVTKESLLNGAQVKIAELTTAINDLNGSKAHAIAQVEAEYADRLNSLEATRNQLTALVEENAPRVVEIVTEEAPTEVEVIEA